MSECGDAKGRFANNYRVIQIYNEIFDRAVGIRFAQVIHVNPTHYYIGSSSIQVLYKGTLIKNASAVLCCSRSLLEVAKNYFTTVLGFLSSRLLPF